MILKEVIIWFKNRESFDFDFAISIVCNLWNEMLNLNNTVFHIYCICFITNNNWLNRFETNKSTFFELNKLFSIWGSTFSIKYQRRKQTFISLFLPFLDLCKKIFLWIFILPFNKEAAIISRACSNQRNILCTFFCNMSWHWVVHVNKNVQPTLMITDDCCRLLLCRLPIRTQILFVINV